MTTSQGAASDLGTTPRFEARSIFKRFGATVALDDVSLSVAKGEVHALLGANGAGKSTLIKAIAGAEAPDRGDFVLDGVVSEIRDPQGARALGISVIHQQLSVIGSLTVAENYLVKSGTRQRRFFPDRSAARREVAALLESLDEKIDPDIRCDELPFAQRQLVEIAIATAGEVRLLVMDEPTSGLTRREQQAFVRVIRRLQASGVAVIYVSHKMNEVFEIADSMTVLRGGRRVAQFSDVAKVDPDEVVEQIVGRRLASMAHEASAVVTRDGNPATLSVHELVCDRVHRVSFHVRPCEIVGLFGVVGSGTTQIAEAVTGARSWSGSISISGTTRAIRSVTSARRNRVSFVPSDHHIRGVVPEMSVRENALMGLERWTRFFRSESRRVVPSIGKILERLNLVSRGPQQQIRELSGGNQQKVVFARAIVGPVDLLVLEDPTQGIDVGSKADIYAEMGRQRATGTAILLVSSETLELATVCDRVLVIRDGHLVGELNGEDIEEQAILTLSAL